ncbi:c-type cytochrome [Anoxybacillus sp. J5B_2022]|uniref:c-type cytochrome n=1 Tax=Anoxybacillus sp. J5B_2022 TaxID=3003246 RepID=UPI002285D46E|nr:cytochrome c [Anoxybacillus sp. J5B_2022]MCZ0756185.1 c-type cytochrome [Anoxybacillus sp. J5B_2022]
MKQSLLIFLLSAVIGLAGGYTYFHFANKEPVKEKQPVATEQNNETSTGQKATAVSSKEGEIFKQKGCIACHSISKLNVQGGTTGPDLSNAYKEVEGKHGKPIEEFLKAPTSAVMSGVIKSNPLTDEERAAIIQALKVASEK